MIDTGADISVVKLKIILPYDNKRQNIDIRSACGTKISALGRSDKGILEIEKHKMCFSPLIIDTKLDCVIIGVDMIQSNPHLLINRLRLIQATQLNKIEAVSETSQIILDDFEEYKNIFKKEIDNTTTCNMIEHLIELTDYKPTFCKPARIPLHVRKK
ncbi:putative transposable element [Pseudoloma neurophilia]|uniref:Putative transposable element n=1 Tax=Pseudoloma neurophilia TaxID=146866 RepID=A0A0R0LVT2_9MICR|nr:putative transposable element [Pseudoloma neurophilia]